MILKGKKILITGGLGFIGINAVRYFSKENTVCVIDDGSRIGFEVYKQALTDEGVQFEQVDVGHMDPLRVIYDAFEPEVVLHLAAQVAVTLSIVNPVRDFSSNVQGTINLLELARNSPKKPVFLYASTNKVYSQRVDNVMLKDGRYCLEGRDGFDEKTPLSFSTPYGCSKGAADQYVLDYARTYGLKTVAFRQSCIYGPHQFGFEDQGWVAWFVIGALLEKPLTIYGDGCQVRDLLYIDDLLDVYKRAIENIDQVQGEAFNIGGGPENTLSINDLVRKIEGKTGRSLSCARADWRAGDQKVFICDIRKASERLGWAPKVSVDQGLGNLMEWVKSEKKTIARIFESGQYVGKKYNISVVIPAKNEEESLPAVLNELKVVVNSSPYRMEVIVVNDRSTDKTAAVAGKFDFVKVVDNQFSSGKGGALRYGFESAQGEYIAMLDADFSHDSMDLPALLQEAKKHQGLVVGSRIYGGSDEYTRVRAFGNVLLTWFFGCMHGRYLSDALNGFKVFHRDVYHQFVYTSVNFEIEIELLTNALRLGRKISEYPSHERKRSGGKLKSSVVKHGTLFMTRIIYEKFRKAARRPQ
jgi:CDP-paratose 2-epimerase